MLFQIGNSQKHGATKYSDEIAEIIIHALKLADKVTGDPTEGMESAAVDQAFKGNVRLSKEVFEGMRSNASRDFKAMIAQAEKEIG